MTSGFHKSYKSLKPKIHGFTLIEIMVVVVIMMIVLLMIWSSFSKLNKSQVLDKEIREVSSIVNEARQRTLFSKDDSSYGVHFENDRTILFKGTIYSAGDSNNEIKELNSLVRISTISLNGGGSDVVFNRLTGSATKSGSIIFTLQVSPNTAKTFTIATTGITNISN